jgi:hypothetical protein
MPLRGFLLHLIDHLIDKSMTMSTGVLAYWPERLVAWWDPLFAVPVVADMLRVDQRILTAWWIPSAYPAMRSRSVLLAFHGQCNSL